MYGPAGFSGHRPAPQRGPNSGTQKPPLSDLPPNLKAMFEARPIIPYKPPAQQHKHDATYTGISSYTNLFETTPPPKTEVFIPPNEQKQHMKEKLQKLHEEKNELLAADWNPNNNPKATENAYLTLFIGRLSYDTTEKKLRREFDIYGSIRTITIVTDQEGKPRGYAFIQYEKEEDVMTAYKKMDGKKIDGRRIVVDVERGRTVRNWRPTRLGGGKGGRPAVKSKKQLAEEAAKALLANEAERQRVVYGPGGSAGSGGGGYREPPRDSMRENGARSGGPGLGFRGDDRVGDRGDRGGDRASSRDRRGVDRGDRGGDRASSRDRRGVDRGNRGADRGADRGDRGADRGGDRGDRGVDRGADRGDRGVDRGGSRDHRGSDRDARGRAGSRDRGGPPPDRRRGERSRSRDRYTNGGGGGGDSRGGGGGGIYGPGGGGSEYRRR